jgi:hypothetical protein
MLRLVPSVAVPFLLAGFKVSESRLGEPGFLHTIITAAW